MLNSLSLQHIIFPSEGEDFGEVSPGVQWTRATEWMHRSLFCTIWNNRSQCYQHQAWWGFIRPVWVWSQCTRMSSPSSESLCLKKLVIWEHVLGVIHYQRNSPGWNVHSVLACQMWMAHHLSNPVLELQCEVPICLFSFPPLHFDSHSCRLAVCTLSGWQCSSKGK
jgi:hypothetical protein